MHARSPFPGMDPWLERHWGNVRHSFVQHSCDQIAERLPAALFATVEETAYSAVEDEDGEFSAVLGHIEIRKLEGDQPLVTAIEVISPTNKLDARNRRRYVQKRDAYYAAGAGVVEIDLLRAGDPLIDVPWGRVAARLITPYKACIRRVPAADADEEVEYYPLPLRERLPRLGIPLRATDADVVSDLQQPIDRAYAMGRYGMRLDYASPPPGPLLSADDAAWVAEQLQRRGA